MAVAAVWSRVWQHPLIFPMKNTLSGLRRGLYERSLREERGAPSGAQTVEIVTYSAPGSFGRHRADPDRVRDGPLGPKSSRPPPKSSRSWDDWGKIIPSSRLLGKPEAGYTSEASRDNPKVAQSSREQKKLASTEEARDSEQKPRQRAEARDSEQKPRQRAEAPTEARL